MIMMRHGVARSRPQRFFFFAAFFFAAGFFSDQQHTG